MEKYLELGFNDLKSAPLNARIFAKALGTISGERVPITSQCTSYEDLKGEVENFKKELDLFLIQAKEKFAGVSSEEPEFNPEDSVENIWKFLSDPERKNELSARFNSLGRETREKLAEYVFATQNAFKGAALIFSTYYDEKENTLRE